MDTVVDLVVALLVLLGAGFTLVGSIGLLRFPDFYTRLHAPTKATTLGVGSLLAGSLVHFSARAGGPSLHELLVTMFLFLTAPVSAHLLARSGRHLGLPDATRDTRPQDERPTRDA